MTLLHDGSTLYITREVATVATFASIAFTPTAGVTYIAKVNINADSGLDIFLDNVKGTGNAATTDMVLDTDFYVGSLIGLSLFFSGEIGDVEFFHGNNSDAKVVSF